MGDFSFYMHSPSHLAETLLSHSMIMATVFDIPCSFYSMLTLDRTCMRLCHKELGSSLLPSSSPLKGERLESSLFLLSLRRNKTELLQQGHRIVVAVVTDNLSIPDLCDITKP
jgi:hypothetical protein